MKLSLAMLILPALMPTGALGQALNLPWSGYGHDAQHTALSPVASQPLNAIHWQASLDLAPQYIGSSLLIHYGSPVITAANTLLMPVKTGAADGWRVEARSGANGSLLYTLATDYTLPPHSWVPSYSPVLSARNRLYYPGAGGTVYYRDSPDSASGASGQLVFYGMGSYLANQATFNNNVKISTPITSDRTGNIYFGFIVLGANPLNLESGIAKITYNGVGSFVTARVAAGGDVDIDRVPTNCAPALSNDHRTLYFSVSNGYTGYLASVDSRNLAPLARIRLKDPLSGNDAAVSNDATSSPTVGPDGDVFYGVLENPLPSNHYRGWLLHFNGLLTQTRIPGAFGWDDTASIVPATAVPSYHGPSNYLLLTKYNNYANVGGDGVNKIAIVDPSVSFIDPVSGVAVMKEILTVAGVTPDPVLPAVREWCINTAAVDPFTKSALVNSEDGKIYRWDFTTNTLIQPLVLTPGVGEAYTPTVIGVDGTVYAVNNATLFAVGN